MATRYVENITIIAELNETVTLPKEMVCIENNFNVSKVTVDKWEDGDGSILTEVTKDVVGEYIFTGTITGYAHKVYCAVVFGDLESNPKSVFPDEIDNLGLPKINVTTADIPSIDDYQYFKAKTSRTTLEQQQLKQLTEALANKIILARDVNHVRNAVIEVEKYCKDLGDRVKELEDKVKKLEERVDDIEGRVDDIEKNAIYEIENIGSGEGVYAKTEQLAKGKKAQFKSLVAGDSIEITATDDEVTIKANIPPAQAPPEVSLNNCGKGLFSADDYKVCKDYIKFTNYLGFKKMPTKTNQGILFVMGAGENENTMNNAGRMFKGDSNLVLELKNQAGDYSGIDINGLTGKVEIYEKEGQSRIDAILGGGKSAYSKADIEMVDYTRIRDVSECDGGC